MQIAGYIKTSLIEWPGKIASVIFTQGCNFRCPFCHNRDLVNSSKVSNLPAGKAGFQSFKEEEILADLANRRKWVDAVVITGGEPTLQTDLSRFLSRLKQMGFLTMIHTNGTRPETIANLLSCYLVDYICMDLKGDFNNYSNYTNYSNGQTAAKVQESMKLIIQSGIEYEFRTTVVPGLHDIKNLTALAEQVKFLVQKSKIKNQRCQWFLQQFRPMNTLDKKYLKVKPFSKEEMEAFQKELQKIIPQTLLRGV